MSDVSDCFCGACEELICLFVTIQAVSMLYIDDYLQCLVDNFSKFIEIVKLDTALTTMLSFLC